MWTPIYEEIHPAFAWMRNYLERIAPTGKFPAASRINFNAFGELRPFVNLVDVDRTGPQLRFRYRLIGSRQTKFAGRDITGLYVEDAVLPLFIQYINKNMLSCVLDRQAYYSAFAMPHPGRDFIRTERIYFPLAEDGETIDTLLIMNGYPDDDDDNLPSHLPPEPLS